MKRTTRTIRTVALALALAMLMTALALTLSACGNKIVMTFEADNGKTYTEIYKKVREVFRYDDLPT